MFKFIYSCFSSIYGRRTMKKAKEIASDPEQSQIFKKYAIMGIVFSLVAVALIWPCFYGGIWIIKWVFTVNLAIIGNIILGAIGLFLIIFPVWLATRALIYPVAQLKVNKRWWSWVSLAICLISIAACAFLIYIVAVGYLNSFQ